MSISEAIPPLSYTKISISMKAEIQNLELQSYFEDMTLIKNSLYVHSGQCRYVKDRLRKYPCSIYRW
jgi:hypothetical protein